MIPIQQPYLLEACVTSLQQALRAQQKGAHRIEICSHLEFDGMTPEFSLVQEICEQISIAARIMIRSTSYGFEVDQEGMDDMIKMIILFKQLPIDGFVMGALKERRVDRDAMTSLLQAAHPFHVTFHKAIDVSQEIWEDIDWLNNALQIDTLLTSGGKETASEGIDQILKIKAAFKRNTMAGGKILPGQLSVLHEALGLTWYHGSRITGD